MLKTFRFRLKASKSQRQAFTRQLEVHRFLYNQCLEHKIERYNTGKVSVSCFDLIKLFVPEHKGKSNYSAMQQTVRRLDKAYQSFFRKHAAFPRFRGKGRFRTIVYATIGDGCKFNIDKSELYLQFVGKVQCKVHRLIPENYQPKSLSVTLKNGELYLNLGCEYIPDESRKIDGKAIGIDFGIKSTITTSNGIQIQSPYFYKSKHKEIAKLCRKKKYKALGKVHAKIQNKRQDFNHKLSRKIVQDYDVICLENLKPSEITTNIKNINRRLYDVGISQLIQFLTYKAESAGKSLVLVNPAYTTQKCSNCGNVKAKELNERIHECTCGYSDDRDINAAKNILRLGLQSLEFNSAPLVCSLST